LRRVPKILVIGNGRMANHWRHYLQLLGIHSDHWYRSLDIDLNCKIRSAEQIFLAISDSAILDFYHSNPLLKDKTCVHFSGSLYDANLLGIHFLQSFAQKLYTLSDYQSIPTIIDFPKEIYEKNFPYLNNEVYQIPPIQKPLYHALCVVSGNFPQLLWHDCEKLLKKMQLPKKILKPYLNQCVTNFFSETAPLTGPIVRKDLVTIESNQKSLKGSRLSSIYSNFYNTYKDEELQ